jgi:hypothetical protein
LNCQDRDLSVDESPNTQRPHLKEMKFPYDNRHETH